MMNYEGKCVGGPWDGKSMAHTTKVKTFLRDGGTELEAVNIGEYRMNDFNTWHWFETKEGHAMNVLFGNVG